MRNNESITNDKLKSAKSLLFGDRASKFDVFCSEIPRPHEIQAIQSEVGREEIKNVIFDLDGTLVHPYAEMERDVIFMAMEYQRNNIKNLFLLTHCPKEKMSRIKKFENLGFTLIDGKKPSLETFKSASSRYNLNPKETAMIGNFPITDMPLTSEGEDSYLGLNILVKSIPPRKKDFKSTKEYARILFFHSLAILTTKIVLQKNKNIICI